VGGGSYGEHFTLRYDESAFPGTNRMQIRQRRWLGALAPLLGALVLAASGLAPSWLHAQTKSTAPAPVQNFADEPYVIEHLSAAVRFEADGTGQREQVARIRIQSESGVRQFGLLVYPYMASFETFEVVYVKVRKPDGSVVETPSSEMQDLDSAVSREAPMYTDQRERHIAVKSLAVGDVLETDLKWTIHDAVAPGHFWYDDNFFSAGICLDESLEVNVPANLPVKVSASKPAPEVKVEGSRKIYSFHTSHLEKAKAQGKTPDDEIPAWEKNVHGVDPPAVRVSSFSTWAEVGSWYEALQKPRIEVTPKIRATAEEITKGKTSDEEKIRAIYDYVSSRIRYIGIDLGYGRYTPHAAEDVLSNRYGDCKDKETLFAALLEAEGIHSYPVLISSTYREDASFPSPSLFDHVITAIPKGDSFLFLDTTPEVAPYGLLLAGLRDRQALVIPDDKSARLTTTPADPPFLSREKFRMEASIDYRGTLDGKTRLEDRNDAEVFLRLAYRNTPQNNWTELTQNIVGRLGFGGTVSDVSVEPPENTSAPFWISYDYHRKDYSDWANHRITLPFPPIFLPELNDAQKKSKDPLPLGPPQEIVYDTLVKLPEGIQPVLPSGLELINDFADYSASYTLEKGVLHGTRKLTIKLREVPGSERSLYDFFTKKIRDEMDRWIFLSGDYEQASPLRKAQALLSEGNPTDAVALLEKAATQDPEDKNVRLALGRAYLRLDNDVKASEQFQKALQGEPSAAILNSVAYEYVTANRRLGEAAEYAARAVAQTSAETVKVSLASAEAADYLRMTELAAEWDTLGWAKFRMGDATGGEKYILAAWKLWQRALIGEHLAEVYEKLGRKREAIEISSLALAAPGLDEEPYLRGKLLEMRQRLGAGGSPQNDDHRRSAAGIALSEMRALKVPRKVAFRGGGKNAIYAVALEGKHTADVHFVSGDRDLEAEAPSLAAAKFDQPLPDSTPVRILRAGWFSCSRYTTECTMVFFLTDDKPSIDMVVKNPD
jgi:hypothetical protein